ncbi:MAG: 16S rRNA (guanine(527)-N(7))-methyltransferase RsmG [bacterium]
MKMRQKLDEKVWEQFQEHDKLSDIQVEQFKKYTMFLEQKNKEFNLTAITDLSGIVRQHFSDSLTIRNFIDLSKISVLADIGSGAGFPGIPLKILYPHLTLILIEVKNKKRQFLQDVANLLELEDVYVNEYDWRTFLRITEFDVDLFVTKAALPDVELCRAFKPGCRYKQTQIAYWAGQEWEPHSKVVQFVRRVEEYKLGKKNRKLIFFCLDEKKPIE